MIDPALIIGVFALIGGGLKYIDEAFDEEVFNRTSASCVAAVILTAWIALSVVDITSGTILLSVLVGVLFTGKIDNKVFALSTLTIILSLVYVQKVLWMPLVFLTLAGMIDEKCNDYVDSHSVNRLARFFFLHRFTMKAGVLSLAILSVFPIYYFAAFLLFDIAYDTVGVISRYQRAEAEQDSSISETVDSTRCLT